MALLKKKTTKKTSSKKKEVVVEAEVKDEGIQTTFNTDDIDVLVAEGDVENVEVPSEN